MYSMAPNFIISLLYKIIKNMQNLRWFQIHGMIGKKWTQKKLLAILLQVNSIVEEKHQFWPLFAYNFFFANFWHFLKSFEIVKFCLFWYPNSRKSFLGHSSTFLKEKKHNRCRNAKGSLMFLSSTKPLNKCTFPRDTEKQMARIDKKAGIVRFFRSVQSKMTKRNSLMRSIYEEC